VRRPKRSSYTFSAEKLRDLMSKAGLSPDQLQGGMRARGHRVEVSSYLVGRSVPSSEVLLDLCEILSVDISSLCRLMFNRRKVSSE